MALQNRVVEEIVAQTNTIPTNVGLYNTFTNQSIIVWTLKTKSLLPPFTKGRNSPLW
jgi:hypothetical protein